MSWTFVNSCFGCIRISDCPDMPIIQKAINEIHCNPKHGEKGGAGSILVTCYKRTEEN